MSNFRLKEVASEAENVPFFNSFYTAAKFTKLIGLFGQLISGVTEFYCIFKMLGGDYTTGINSFGIVRCKYRAFGIRAKVHF